MVNVKVAVGLEIRVTRDSDDTTLHNDPKFWHEWGPLAPDSEDLTVRVDFDPPLPLRPNAQLNEFTLGIRTLVCVNGDAAGYGWSIKVVAGGLQAWFSDEQVSFVAGREELAHMWKLVEEPISKALREYRAKLWRN